MTCSGGVKAGLRRYCSPSQWAIVPSLAASPTDLGGHVNASAGALSQFNQIDEPDALSLACAEPFLFSSRKTVSGRPISINAACRRLRDRWRRSPTSQPCAACADNMSCRGHPAEFLGGPQHSPLRLSVASPSLLLGRLTACSKQTSFRVAS